MHDVEVAALDPDASGRHQTHVVVRGEHLGDLPRTNGRTGHALEQRLARDDEDPLSGDEVLSDPEGLDQHAMRIEVAVDGVRRLDGMTEEREELAVAASAPRLEVAPGLQERGELVDEVVDRESAGQRHLLDLDRADVVASGRTLQVQQRSVRTRACERPADRQGHRCGQSHRERLVVVVLVHREQRVPLEQVALTEVAELLHRHVVAVVGDGSWLVANLVPEQVEAPAEVHVFVEHEKPLVEPADLAVDVGAHEHGGARAEEHILGNVVLRPVGLLDLTLVAHAEPGHRAVDVVDQATVPVEHLARDRPDPWVGCERLHRGSDPLRVRPRVVVEQGDELARRVRDAQVAAAGESRVRPGLDDDDVRERGPDAIGAVIA